MSYKIFATSRFSKKIKRLIKKYPSLKEELKTLFESLEQSPEQGDALGNHCYKIRLAIQSKGKGKSGGARIITYIYFKEKYVYLLTVYDKSEMESINISELKVMIEELPLND